jgi:hypothetical protein
MTDTSLLRCDGCGQPASPEHVRKRLERLESTTRYRPLHIGTLLLGAFAPKNDSEFLYADRGDFAGEAGFVLRATAVSSAGKSPEVTLAEFQRAGFLVSYVLECPLEHGPTDAGAVQAVLDRQWPAALARIRRSLKPKRIVPISQLLEPVLGALEKIDLGCPIVLDGGKPFALDGNAPDEAIVRLGHALAGLSASNR